MDFQKMALKGVYGAFMPWCPRKSLKYISYEITERLFPAFCLV